MLSAGADTAPVQPTERSADADPFGRNLRMVMTRGWWGGNFRMEEGKVMDGRVETHGWWEG
jgi:hypothetical protein